MSIIGETFKVKSEDGYLVYKVTIDDSLSPVCIGISCWTLPQIAELVKTDNFPDSVSPIVMPLEAWQAMNEFIKNNVPGRRS
jgi:hypothetical protein